MKDICLNCKFWKANEYGTKTIGVCIFDEKKLKATDYKFWCKKHIDKEVSNG